MTDTAATKYKEYMTNLQGKQYMTVQGRVKWFRDEHEIGGCIETDFKQVGEYTIATCKVLIDRQMVASGSATVRAWAKGNNPRDIEKAETAAIGRALANAGYGTQFSGDELNDTDYLADSPITTTSTTTPPPSGNKPDAPKSDRRKIAESPGPKYIEKIEKVKGLNVRQKKQWRAWTTIDDTKYPFILWEDHLRHIETELNLADNALDIKDDLTLPAEKQIAVYTKWHDKYQAVMASADLTCFMASFENPAMLAQFRKQFPNLSDAEACKALEIRTIKSYKGGLRHAIDKVQDYIDGQADLAAQEAPVIDEQPSNVTPIGKSVYTQKKTPQQASLMNVSDPVSNLG